jgi:Domain of unknown function (DUF4430)
VKSVALKVLPVVLVALVASVLAGCGLGPGAAPKSVSLLVSREFGTHTVRQAGAPHLSGEETVMSLLMRNAKVQTRYGGGFVQSIDGLAGGQHEGTPIDWFYFINGVLAPKGAADTKVHPGDHVWWDLHDWSQTEATPAVVGSYPEPFLNGIEGKRLPVRVECVAQGEACRTVTDNLRASGVPAAISALGGGDGPETLRVLVGPWSSLGGRPGTAGLQSGPRASGVYARFAQGGSSLTLLDPDGKPTRTLSAGAGLVAATRYSGADPIWLVTGTDSAGVSAAAHALTVSALDGHFAVALAQGQVLPVPAVSP